MTNFTHRSADVERDENGIDIDAHGARIDALVKRRIGYNTQLIGVVKIREEQQSNGHMEQHYIVAAIRSEGDICIHKAMLDSSGQTGLIHGEIEREAEHIGLARMLHRALDQRFDMRVALQNIQRSHKKKRR